MCVIGCSVWSHWAGPASPAGLSQPRPTCCQNTNGCVDHLLRAGLLGCWAGPPGLRTCYHLVVSGHWCGTGLVRMSRSATPLMSGTQDGGRASSGKKRRAGVVQWFQSIQANPAHIQYIIVVWLRCEMTPIWQDERSATYETDHDDGDEIEAPTVRRCYQRLLIFLLVFFFFLSLCCFLSSIRAVGTRARCHLLCPPPASCKQPAMRAHTWYAVPFSSRYQSYMALRALRAASASWCLCDSLSAKDVGASASATRRRDKSKCSYSASPVKPMSGAGPALRPSRTRRDLVIVDGPSRPFIMVWGSVSTAKCRPPQACRRELLTRRAVS